VPRGQVVRPADRRSPPDLDLTYPLVLEPLTRRPGRWQDVMGRGKAVAVDSPGALAALWSRLAATNLPVFAQERGGSAPGRETYHVYVDADGRAVAEFCGRTLRTAPGPFGDTTALEIADLPDVAELGRDIVRRLKLRGVAKLDFARDPAGRLQLLEVNPRFSRWHHAGARAGVNIPGLVYGDLVSRPRPAVGAARTGVRWCRPWTDYSAARLAGLSRTAWLRWVAACQATSAWSWDDPWPLLSAGFRRLVAAGTPVASRMSAGPTLVLEPASPRDGRAR
jgi:predicted ATP-grasp superfamily ATP-dependent carboligase